MYGMQIKLVNILLTITIFIKNIPFIVLIVLFRLNLTFYISAIPLVPSFRLLVWLY